jgi:hypothetical protein
MARSLVSGELGPDDIAFSILAILRRLFQCLPQPVAAFRSEGASRIPAQGGRGPCGRAFRRRTSESLAAAAKDLTCDKTVQPLKQPIINGNYDFCDTHLLPVGHSYDFTTSRLAKRKSLLIRTYSFRLPEH